MRKLIVFAILVLVYTKTTAQKYFSEVTAGYEFGKDNTGSSKKVFDGKWVGVYNIGESNMGIFYTLGITQTFNATGQKPFEKSKLLILGLGQNKELLSNDDVQIAAGVGLAVRMVSIVNSQPKKTDNGFGGGISLNGRYKEAIQAKVEASLTVVPRSNNYTWKRNFVSYELGLKGDIGKSFGLSTDYCALIGTETEVQIPGNNFFATVETRAVSNLNICAYVKAKMFEFFAGIKIVNTKYRSKSNQQNINGQFQNNFWNETDPIGVILGVRMLWWKTK